MSLDLTGRHRSSSVVGSGRSTPTPRASRRAAEDELFKADKGLRRYGATIERALSSWETSPAEWADYIAFLGRLLKAIQGHPTDITLLPHSEDVAYKLSQCLNPALPSGVHQKALDIYAYVFSTFGQRFLVGHLHEFLPGLAAVLSFASLSVRPAVYSLYEDHLLQLPAADLRPVLKALVLSLLPALEDETSEDYDRAFRILDSLEGIFSLAVSPSHNSPNHDGYFWQCLFLAVITSQSKRQGALNFLILKLPKFAPPAQTVEKTNGLEGSSEGVATADAILSPEPGLLVRCFAAGLADSQLLIQRGFLDLLVTHIPLHSPFLVSRAREDDIDRLVTAATHVLLRREMSLNRRLWTWFLGSNSDTNDNHGQTPSSATQRRSSADVKADQHFRYFDKYGRTTLERCIVTMFQKSDSEPRARARPFRICLSLMDRWEIGGSIVPRIFLPAIRNAYEYSIHATLDDTAEVLRSASLFFDGVESMLIWANLLKLLKHQNDSDSGEESGLRMLSWIVQHFNVKDEEMVTIHMPLAAIYLLDLLVSQETTMARLLAGLDVLHCLLDVIPERTFVTSSTQQKQDLSRTTSASAATLCHKIEDFYQAQGLPLSNNDVPGLDEQASLLFGYTKELTLRSLQLGTTQPVSQCIVLLLVVISKVRDQSLPLIGNLLVELSSILATASSQGRTLAFTNLNAIVTVLAEVGEIVQDVQTSGILPTLLKLLYSQLWVYLSPSYAKHHVEAVKAIWQLHDSSGSSGLTEDALTALVRVEQSGLVTKYDRVEAIERFAVLWNHTVVSNSSTKAARVVAVRRGSSMATVPEKKTSVEKQAILTTPLMLVVDALQDHTGPIFDVASSWIRNVPSLEQILSIHFERLAKLISLGEITGHDPKTVTRTSDGNLRDLEYLLRHFLNILTCGDDRVWPALNEIWHADANHEASQSSGLEILSKQCGRIICDERFQSTTLEREAISLLQFILSKAHPAPLKKLQLDSTLLNRLIKVLALANYDMQGPLIKTVTLALGIRLAPEETDESTSASRSKTSIAMKRSSEAGMQRSPSASNASLVLAPPPQLLECLRLGFSSNTARKYLDQWLLFLSNVLPVFADAIFSSLIPMVECLCKELAKTHEDLISMSSTRGSTSAFPPETIAITLLEALEMILASAHERLEVETLAETDAKVNTQPRGLLSNVTGGVFKVDAPPIRNAQSNSRLTVILALQDAVRVAMELWVWSNQYAEFKDFDQTNAATTAYNALKVRNRTRHLLEQICNAEPLETLEVIAHQWCYNTVADRTAVTMNVLHIIHGLKPKNIVPATLDAMCSRTNIGILPPSRQSSLTVELTPVDVAFFLQAYLRSVEDDAMDEVWPDCTAFLRDVLSNPLPYRQVLPSLLSLTLLLAQKIDNTNFGEQRKMRKELGDLFLRLLTATSTTLTTGYAHDFSSSNGHATSNEVSNSDVGRTSMGLLSVLADVVAHIEVIVESADRTTAAMNTITTNFLAPLLHAKTFPTSMTFESLDLLLQITKKGPSLKPWKKDLMDVFNDSRLLMTPVETMEKAWFPILHQCALHDKERMPELVSRLVAPSSAGIMFGVGASTARLEADRKAQLNLRRICIMLLASPIDTFVSQLRDMWEKLVSLFEADSASSPSAAVKAELFMLCRALVLSITSIHLAPLWPVINESLQSALASLSPGASKSNAFGNLALLQACKLLDLLVALSPEEFQLHEWLYISDTVDAVYQPSDWKPSALADQIAEILGSDGVEDATGVTAPTPTISTASGRRRPLIMDESNSDKGDYKAMTHDDFARAVLRPFLSQLSIHAYEGVYSLDEPEPAIWRRLLLEDTLDLSTIVE